MLPPVFFFLPYLSRDLWRADHRSSRCRLIWLILHQGVRYEERGPALSKRPKQQRTVRMIRNSADLATDSSPQLLNRVIQYECRNFRPCCWKAGFLK